MANQANSSMLNSALQRKVDLLTSAPGVNIAGIAGPGWVQPDCGLYRGFVSPAPEFSSASKQYCDPNDPGQSCNPENPNGGWATPLEVQVAASSFSRVNLFATLGAVMRALSITAVYNTGTGAELTPANIRIGEFSSGRTRQQYPGWGGQSQVTDAGGAMVQNLSEQIPENIMQPATAFTEQVLLDGQNNLPPSMSRVNLGSAQNGFRWRVNNGNAFAVTLIFKAYLSYNNQVSAG